MTADRPSENKSGIGTAVVTERDVETVAETQAVLDRSLVRSVAWNAASSWVIQIVSWLVSLEVMRLLNPQDFGIAAMAIVLLPFLGSIAGLGIPRAIVALPDFTENQLAQLSAVNVIMGCFCLLLGIVIAKPFAAFFRTPPLATLLIVYSFGVLMSALTGVPRALLLKERRFRFTSTLAIITMLLGSVTVVWLALLGFGYWALILGNMIPSVFATTVILCVHPFKLAWPRFNSIREPLRFGWHITVSTMALNGYERLDNFVAARVLGQAALGLYGNAWNFANVPMEKVASMVTTVIPSYLAVVRDDAAALRRYLYGLTEVVALGAFPACIGLGLVARECVPLILGHKWDGMIPPLQVLSCYAAFRAIVALLPKVLAAVGNSRYVMWNDLAALVILPIAFYVGSYRGITGIAWGWVVAYPIVVLPLYKKTFDAIDARIGDYLRSVRPAFTGTIAMIPAVEWVKHTLDPSRPLWSRLVIEVAAGALVYTGAVLLFHRQRALLMIELVKKSLHGKAPRTGLPSI
jgi:O-antigen/teichoic acid export membrane protein